MQHHPPTGDTWLADLPDVRTSTPVDSVTPAAEGTPAVVRTTAGAADEFDAVVFATHTDTTLALLGAAAPQVGGAKGEGFLGNLSRHRVGVGCDSNEAKKWRKSLPPSQESFRL